jgi:hypothetical protein
VFAARGSKHLPQDPQHAALFDISKLLVKRKWKHQAAESTNWKQRFAKSTSSVLELFLWKEDGTNPEIDAESVTCFWQRVS